MKRQTVGALIVGAGQAAGELAVALRQEGFSGRIAVVGDEPALPYQRPPLSKAYLSGKIEADGLLLRPETAYQQAGVEFMLGRRVTRIDPAGRQAYLDQDETIDFDWLALATGGRARRLTIPGSELSGIHYLRTLSDVRALRKEWQPGARLAVVGGGYVGLEVAAVAVRAGLQVTVLEAASRVLARVTAPEVSGFYEALHRQHGVEILTGVEVEAFAEGACPGRVGELRCKDGRTIEADLVVVGVGLLPNVELAEEAGLAVNNGIVIDERGRTSAPTVVALGDCASQYHPFYNRHLRLESVPSAIEQARNTAALICGKPARATGLPWFWSDQYDLKLQMAGLSLGHDQLIVRGSMEQRAFAAFYLKDGVMISVDTIGRPADFMMAKRLIAARIKVDETLLADESHPLKALLPA